MDENRLNTYLLQIANLITISFSIKRILFLIFTIINIRVAGQNHKLGFGFNYGYKSIFQDAGFYLKYRFKDITDLQAGLNKGKFCGYGFSLNSRINFLQINLQPFIGMTYVYNFGQDINIKSSNYSASYYIGPNNFYVPEIGLSYRLKLSENPNKPNNIGYILFSINGSYIYSVKENKALFKNGYYSGEDEQNLNKRAGNGLGLSLSIGFLFYKARK